MRGDNRFDFLAWADRFTNPIIGSKFPSNAFDCSDYIIGAEKLKIPAGGLP
jgi:hypothetical protein